MNFGAVDLLDLFELVASDRSNAATVLQKTFDWRHTRGLEVGKWFLAIGLALFVTYVTLLLDAATPTSIYLHVAISAVATLCCVFGLIGIWRLRQLDRRYTRLAALVADLEELRPFLVRLRRNGIL